VRKTIVALLGIATAAVGGIGVWADQDREERFCTLGAPITPRHFELAGYEVMMQDSGGEPGPDPCDGDDRPGRAESDDPGDPDGPGQPSSTAGGAPATVPDDPRVVLGFDCRYRDADGVVVANAEPNRPDGTCTIAGR